MSIVCVYRIKNKRNRRSYVGSTLDYMQRVRNHRCQLKKGTHKTKKLQSDWIRFGEEAFVFEILETVSIDNRKRREQFWMDRINCVARGYNHCPRAGSPKGYKHSEESRQKYSECHRGVRLTEEHKRRIGRGVKRTFKAHPEIVRKFLRTKALKFAMRSGEAA